MTTTLGFKNIIDLPRWRPEAPALANPPSGSCIAYDPRNEESGCPYIFLFRGPTSIDAYNVVTGDWISILSPNLYGSVGPGAAAVFSPSWGPRGILGVGSAPTKLMLSIALPVSINQLANRGDGVGYTIKISDCGAGGSGKTEYKKIVGNTLGISATIYLDSALTFTPVTGSKYEIRSGQLTVVACGTPGGGSFKTYDLATASYVTGSGMNYAGLPTPVGTESVALHLCENFVPYDRKIGEGIIAGGATYDAGAKNCILATASTTTTITGSGMPADLAANEFRNYQVRIVEDTTTPTACNQRGRILSNTAGATGAFTLYLAWAVTPSATAKFVIENDDDTILLFGNASSSPSTFSLSGGTGGTWMGPAFNGNGNVMFPGGFVQQTWGAVRDPNANYKHSHFIAMMGGGTNTLYQYDIAASAGGTWTTLTNYGGKFSILPSLGTSWAYDGVTQGGKYMYGCPNGGQHMVRMDIVARSFLPATYFPYPQGAPGSGNKLAIVLFVDGATKITGLYHMSQSNPQLFSMLLTN